MERRDFTVMDYGRMLEGKSRADLVAICRGWHRRLSNLKYQRGETSATYAQAGKRDRLIIEMTH